MGNFLLMPPGVRPFMLPRALGTPTDEGRRARSLDESKA